MPILQNTADSSFLPREQIKEESITTVLQEVAAVALRITDQVCCLESLRTSHCCAIKSVRNLLGEYTQVRGKGGDDMHLKIVWTDSSSWSLPSAEAKVSDLGSTDVQSRIEILFSPHTVCKLWMFLQSQMNPGLPVYMPSP